MVPIDKRAERVPPQWEMSLNMPPVGKELYETEQARARRQPLASITTERRQSEFVDAISLRTAAKKTSAHSQWNSSAWRAIDTDGGPCRGADRRLGGGQLLGLGREHPGPESARAG